MDVERRAFIEAIREDPEDDFPRLVFADWLDEQGDPLGEFIRVQCELAVLSEADDPGRHATLKSREDELLKAHKQDWAGEIDEAVKAGIVDGYRFERGLVEQLSMEADAFIEHGECLVDHAPGLVTLRLKKHTNRFKDFINLPVMQRVLRLVLTQWEVNRSDLIDLKQSKQLTQLRGLNLTGCLKTIGAVRQVAMLKNLPALTELSLSGTQGFEELLLEVTEAPLFAQLEHVDLSRCFGNVSFEHALVGLSPDRLRTLKIRNNNVTTPLIRGLGRFANLEHLEMTQTHFSTRIANELAKLTNLKKLRFLSVGQYLLHAKPVDKAVQTLVNSAIAENLEVLIVVSDFGIDGLQSIAQSPNLRKLKSLNANRCDVDTASLLMLAETGLAAHLNVLTLGPTRDVRKDDVYEFFKLAGWEKDCQRWFRVKDHGNLSYSDLNELLQYLGMPTDLLW